MLHRRCGDVELEPVAVAAGEAGARGARDDVQLQEDPVALLAEVGGQRLPHERQRGKALKPGAAAVPRWPPRRGPPPDSSAPATQWRAAVGLGGGGVEVPLAHLGAWRRGVSDRGAAAKGMRVEDGHLPGRKRGDGRRERPTDSRASG